MNYVVVKPLAGDQFIPRLLCLIYLLFRLFVCPDISVKLFKKPQTCYTNIVSESASL